MAEVHYGGSVHQELHLYNALKAEKNEDYNAVLHHLVESICPVFRYRAILLFQKYLQDPGRTQPPILQDNLRVTCPTTAISDNVQLILNRVEEMPKEWTVVQLTAEANQKVSAQEELSHLYARRMYISAFNCGQRRHLPSTVLVGAPKDNKGQVIELLRMREELSRECCRHMSTPATQLFNYAQRMKYYEGLELLDQRMKEIVRLAEENFLREWRVLLIGKYKDEALEKEFDKGVDEILQQLELSDTDDNARQLLKAIAKGLSHLTGRSCKVQHAVGFVLHNKSADVVRNVTKAITKRFREARYQNQERHPVILIVDGYLDGIPWEMTEVLIEQPVTRMHSLHFLYALYKEHEDDIVNGWKIIREPPIGSSMINPSVTLKAMEKRMSAFVEYQLPDWRVMKGIRPTSEQFAEAVANCDIFHYSGHGDGFQFMSAKTLEKLRVNAVVLLFGCSSVQLKADGPLCEPTGTHQNYIMACSPCIVGMLWNVLDVDTDTLTTQFLTRWIPTNKPTVDWRSVFIDDVGEVGDKYVHPTNITIHEPELQTALRKAKRMTKYYMTRAGCVARGLPIKIVKR